MRDMEIIGEETSDGQTFRRQTSCVPCSVSLTYGKSHCAGRFLDSVETLHRVSKSAEVGL